MKASWTRLFGAALALLCTLAGCRNVTVRFDDDATPFQATLARVAVTDDTRAGFEFGDAKAITALAASDDPKDVWGQLSGFGASSLARHATALSEVAGIDLRGARFMATAGVTPKTAGLIVGGQDQRRVETSLAANGWRAYGLGYTAPTLSAERGEAAVLALTLAHVRMKTSDTVLYAPASGSITPIVTPTHRTLATDAEFSALARCLGDVLVAQIVRGRATGDQAPSLAAVGVRRTTDRTSAPRALICTSWTSDKAADAAVGRQRDALRDGRGLDGRPHKETYRDPTVDRVAGKGSLVRAEADTPRGAAVVLAGLNRHDLPGLAAL
jgi:hypothetical protein